MRVDAIGFVEVVGLVAAIEAGDAMVKAAQVRLLKQHTISPGWITVVVEGDLASCKAAVDAGKAAAARLGRVVSTLVLGRPDRDTEGLVLDHLRPEPEVPPPSRSAKARVARKAAPVPPAPSAVAAEPSVPRAAAVPSSLPAPVSERPATATVADLSLPAPELPPPSAETPQLPGLEAVLTALVDAPPPVPSAAEPPPAETLLAYIAAVTRGRTCQEVARRFHLAPAAAREILEQWVADGRLDKTGSRYLVAQRLI